MDVATRICCGVVAALAALSMLAVGSVGGTLVFVVAIAAPALIFAILCLAWTALLFRAPTAAFAIGYRTKRPYSAAYEGTMTAVREQQESFKSLSTRVDIREQTSESTVAQP